MNRFEIPDLPQAQTSTSRHVMRTQHGIIQTDTTVTFIPQVADPLEPPDEDKHDWYPGRTR